MFTECHTLPVKCEAHRGVFESARVALLGPPNNLKGIDGRAPPGVEPAA